MPRRLSSVLLALTLSAAAGCANHAKPSITLYESGNYQAAAIAADEGLAAHPDDDALWGMRIRSALALGDGDAIVRAYTGYTAHRAELDKPLLKDLATATLAQALNSPSAKLELVAIEAIEDIEIQGLADAVVAILHGGYAQAGQVAGDSLRSPDAEARRIAVEGVGKKVGRPAAADLEKAASDSDPRVRRAAVFWLGQIKDTDAVAIFAQRIKDEDDGVRAAAARALARVGIGDLGAYGKAAAADAALPVRIAAIDLLVAAHLDSDLGKLARDPDPILAVEASLALHDVGLARDAVQRAMASPDGSVRAGAANYLVRALGKDAALGPARQLAHDKELGVRLAAARVLAHAGDATEATKVFVAALGADDSRDHAAQAAADLAALGDARGAARLTELVRDPRRTPEQRAAAAAAHRSAHRVTPGLLAALADTNAIVRVEAAAALGALSKDRER